VEEVEEVEEVSGLLDAVFFAGDFVDHPNRASQWFDRANEDRPAFFPAMQGRLRQLHFGGTFHGGALLQRAPLLGILGNHEVSGRWFPEQNDIVTMYNDSQPRWYSGIRYRDYLAGGNTADPDYVRNHSHENLTYDEMWPSPSGTDLPYWSHQYGDVSIIGLHLNRIWRLWGSSRKGKEGEAPASVNGPNAWGFGDHLFEGIGMGTAQYDWLVSELASSAFQNAKYKVVMAHQTVFGLGDNAYPVVAAQEAKIDYDLGSGPKTLEITFPLTESEWDAQIAPLLGSITSIDYAYETEEDLWRHQIGPLLVNAGVDLVFCGHSHLWNRSKVGTMHYLESSNVGNSFGARYDDGSESETWLSGAFPPGDPHGRIVIAPTHFNPMQAWEGFSNPLPFVSSNRLTVFSILDTGDGAVRSYVFDTENPSAGVVLMDEFFLSGLPQSLIEVPDLRGDSG
ncbi:MAG: metallophosphoesterase, partial [Verrucomicrobiaceae bacterium]|nr:metallophosphoesterase [Verrucomicrobiaceae bacterium]